MIFDFNPWQLDVDIDLTKKLYKEVDYSTDKTIYEILEDEDTSVQKIYRMFINFLIRGKILALPKYQKDIYSDEEVFGKNFPESIKILSSNDEDNLKVFDNGIGACIIFKHPCFHYDDENFKEWDCGYILGTILIMKDM